MGYSVIHNHMFTVVTGRTRASAIKKRWCRDLRKRQTKGERLLYTALKEQIQNTRFRRQHFVFGWIADFWCNRFRVVIEVDEPHHFMRLDYDRERDRALKKKGIRTIRVSSIDVEFDPTKVAIAIRKLL